MQQYNKLIVMLNHEFSEAAFIVKERKTDVLAFSGFPRKHWKKICSDNAIDVLLRQINRATETMGVFSSRKAARRLLGVILSEKNKEWSTLERYIKMGLAEEAEMICIDRGKEKTSVFDIDNDTDRDDTGMIPGRKIVGF